MGFFWQLIMTSMIRPIHHEMCWSWWFLTEMLIWHKYEKKWSGTGGLQSLAKIALDSIPNNNIWLFVNQGGNWIGGELKNIVPQEW